MVKYIAIDFETANDDFSSICQVGIAIVKLDSTIETFSSYINPDDYFTNTWLHGIDEEMVKDSPKFPDIVNKINGIIGDNFVIGYGGFDKAAFIQACEKYSLNIPCHKWINAHNMVRRHWTQFAKRGYALENISNYLSIPNENHHDAENDAIVCSKIINKILNESNKDITWWSDRIKKPIFKKDRCDLPKQDINIDGELYGKIILFTGELSITRSEATILANNAGAAITNSPSKKVDYLIVGNQDLRKTNGNSISNKHRKILELRDKGNNILIIKEDDFKVLINNDYKATKVFNNEENNNNIYEKDIECSALGISIRITNGKYV